MVKNRQQRILEVLKPAQGQALVEYALILVLLAVALAFAVAATGPAIGNVFCNVVDNLAGKDSADICGRGTTPLDVAGGRPDLFWATVTWVAGHPQKETPFPTPIHQPPTSGAAVYYTPTPSDTPTQTFTPSNTPTYTPTLTPSIGPTATPSDLAFNVPHVDQVAKPEWWRLGSSYWLGDEGQSWTAQWYDNAGAGTTTCATGLSGDTPGGFQGDLTHPPKLCNQANAVTYSQSDLNFNFGDSLATNPSGAGLTGANTFGAVITRTISLSAATPVIFSLAADDYLRVAVNGVPVAYAVYGSPATQAYTLPAGTYDIQLWFAENGGQASFSFSANLARVNPDDTVSSCSWGQVTAGSNADSPQWEFENQGAGSWPSGATCYLELRGYVDVNSVTNPVLSFWDIWDFTGGAPTAKLQVAEYVTDVNDFFDRAAAVWTDVPLHASATSNYNWTRYEVPIGSYGGTSKRVTFRFALSGSGTAPFKWYLDDMQITDETVAPGTFTVGKFWDLNNRSQMTDFIFNADTDKTLEDNPSLPQTTSQRRWDLTSNNAHTGTGWDDSPGYPFPKHTQGGDRVEYLEMKELVDVTTAGAPPADTEGDTGEPLLSFWLAYDIPVGARLQVEYTRDARDTTQDNWSVIPNGGMLLNYTAPGGTPGVNEQVARTNLTMQYIYVNLNQVPNYQTLPFRLRFALYIQSTYSGSGDGVFIDDIYIERQAQSPYFAYPFYDDAESAANLTAYWLNLGSSWGITNEKAAQSDADTAAAVSPGALGTGLSYSDSPNLNYTPGVTRTLELKYPIDLVHDTPANTTDAVGRAAASEPLLTFWHHRYVSNNVQLYVDMWTPTTATWNTIWTYDSNTHATNLRRQDGWERIEVNLRRALETITSSTWATIATNPAVDDDDVKIRFRFVTGSGATPQDGVYVDEISINDANYSSFKVWPTTSGGDGMFSDHVESMDSGSLPPQWYNRWYAGGIWGATDENTHTGSLSFDVGPDLASYMNQARNVLELKPIIDLTSTPSTDPVYLYFWMPFDINSNHYIRVQYASENASESPVVQNYDKIGGWSTWTNLNYTIDSQQNTSGVNSSTVWTWGRAAANLTSFRGSRIRLRFIIEAPTSAVGLNDFIDDISVVHGLRNIPVPFLDDASSTVNWVPEGSWGQTSQYFIGSGASASDLGPTQWVGWFYDCEQLGETSCSNMTNAANYMLYTTHQTNPVGDCSAPNFLSTSPAGPECVPDIDMFLADTYTPMNDQLSHSDFIDTWAARWTRQVTLQPGATYSVYVITSEGVRLWIDDPSLTTIPTVTAPFTGGPTGRIINDWTTYSSNQVDFATFTVNSTTPITRTLTLEFFNWAGPANLWLAISRQYGSFTDSPNSGSGASWTTVNSTQRGDSALLLNGYFNLTGFPNPSLGYQTLYTLGSQTPFYVEVSTNGGFTWSQVDSIGASASNPITSGWQQRTINLSGTAGNQANVMIRFRLDARAATTSTRVKDGIYLADIRLTP